MKIPAYRIFCVMALLAGPLPYGLRAADNVAPVAASKEDIADSGEDAPTAKPKAEPGMNEYWKAVKLFESKAPMDLEAGRTALLQAANREYTHAQLLLGECYEVGSYGFAQSKSKSAAQFRLAAERGNAFAKVSYGVCLFYGYGVRTDEVKSAEWLNAALAKNADYTMPVPPADWRAAAAKSEDNGVAGTIFNDPVASAQARAHFVLGVIAERRKQPVEAQTHYVAAATAGPGGRAGLQVAALQAALNYAFGRGMPRDQAKATEMLGLAKTLVQQKGISLVHNYADAKLIDDFAVSETEEAVANTAEEVANELEFDIAETFTNRKSKDYNPKESVQWFELAAESGKEWAMLELAFLYVRSDLGAPDLKKAFAWFEKAGGGDSPKHYLGAANLVICLWNGIGAPQDRGKALQIAKKHQDHDIVCYLTTIDQCPKAVITYPDELALNKIWAKDKKDPWAQYLLGDRYECGAGVKSDLSDAEFWYTKAAKAHCGPACRRLGMLHLDNRLDLYGAEALKKSVEYFRSAAERKDAIGTAYLGYLTQNGRGVPKSLSAARQLYEQALAIDPKLPMALNNLGAVFESLFEQARMEHDPAAPAWRDLMLKYYEQAAANGYPLAAVNLARFYRNETLGYRDLTKAYDYFQKAAELGDTAVHFELGQMHEKGEGVPVTPIEAAYHYRLAALDGNIRALQSLTNFYLEGKGGAQDLDRAQFWLERLVQYGYPSALIAYVDVLFMRQDYKQAVDALEDIKDSDNREVAAFAYERLSRCYGLGLGVKVKQSRAKTYRDKAIKLGSADAVFSLGSEKMLEKKEAEAVPLFVKAADAGCAEACFALGKMYFHGQYLPLDRAKSVSYLRKAAQLNHPGALFYLAALTYNRVPEGPSLDEAIEFARHAEALGNKDAPPVREKLERRRAQGGQPQQTTTARPT